MDRLGLPSELRNRAASLSQAESHSSTTNEYCNEASFHRPMNKQDRRSESSYEARLRYDQKPEKANERSCSGSRAQPTAQFRSPFLVAPTTTTPRTLYQALPESTSPQELSSPEESTQLTAEQRKQKHSRAILSVDRMGINNPHTNKKCTRYN
ncbi:hypothetical protein FHG87_014548 [Trinorchestia longiramus]|nr:hypothetical protein FHG87_014548 [Trinorchestia longiramus]